MVPHNESGDRAFWCISGKCLNPGCSPGRRPGGEGASGLLSCPILPSVIRAPRRPKANLCSACSLQHYPFPQQLPSCLPTPPTEVGSRSRDRDGRGRCVVKCVGGRGQHPTRTQEHAQPHYPDPDHHYASPRADAASSRRLAPACRGGAQASGRGEQGARHDNQNGSPEPCGDYNAAAWHTTAACAYTTGQDAPGWWPSAGANRLARQVGRFQMRAPPRQEYGKLSYAGG
jgi:hypothetical protein